MTRLEHASLLDPANQRSLSRGVGAAAHVGGLAIGRAILEPGWRWSEDVKPIVGTEWCEVHHLQLIVSGRLAVIGNAEVLRRPRNIRNLKAVADAVQADYVLLGQLQQGEQGLRFITHFIRLSDATHLKANRIPFPDGDLNGLEQKVLAEFERAVQQHVLSAD